MKPKCKPYRAALYMRLSKDDEGSGESASITTQRKMLRSFASENGFAVHDEYVDDGWSGTNFARPAWTRLIADIEDKKVNLVITKDLSRLGRDYIAAGQYTEIYFPSKGVRYIAINDGYDSESPYTDIAPFKNVINEMYARDTRKKIRSAFQTKMQEGAFIGNFAPYGYQKDPANKNHLVIDPVAAAVVQEIFERAARGDAPSVIANELNRRNVPPPSVYRCMNHPHLNLDNLTKYREWTHYGICKMLRNVVYLGHVAQGKTTKVSFKSSLTLTNSRDEWIVVENMHEAIISQETFDRVRKRCVARGSPRKTDFINIFSGIAVCGDCGRNMSTVGTRRQGSAYNLSCGGYKLRGKRQCTNHYIDYKLLYDIVLKELQQMVSLSKQEQDDLLQTVMQEDAGKPDNAAVKIQRELQGRERELDRIIERLYEDNINGKISDERFQKLLARYEQEQGDIHAKLATLEAPPAPNRETTAMRDYLLLLRGLTEIQALTPELLHKLIDKIEVFQGSYENGKRGGKKQQTIRIHYKFIGPREQNIVA